MKIKADGTQDWYEKKIILETIYIKEAPYYIDEQNKTTSEDEKTKKENESVVSNKSIIENKVSCSIIP